MSRHTSPPWTLGPMDNMGLRPISSAEWKNFAKVRTRPRGDDDECEAGLANAALILAAPLLLAALTSVLDSLGALSNPSELYGWMSQEEIDAVFAAIAKATNGGGS